ncbi:S24 family peptidase [Niabella insulamsoli]|uniref:S24 family peptidase n=1 Tax=Niabella insulamsoli TaxID=3144874 RepID=UPI0031FC4524
MPALQEPEMPSKRGKKGEIQYQVKEVFKPVMVTVDHQGRENIVMVPVKARAGYLNGYGDPEFIQSLPAYRLPGLHNGVFRMFEVQGLSMYQTLYDKDIVIGSFVEQARDIRDDRVHILVTKDHGIVIKRVLNRVSNDGVLILKSDNYKDRHLYPPIVLHPEDILEVWYCKMRLTPQFGTPDLYTRLVDLEGRLTLLENSAPKPEVK